MPTKIPLISSPDAFKNYESVLEKVASFFDGVMSEYGNEMNCQKGCAQCCVGGLEVLPVEAEYIKKGIGLLKNAPVPGPSPAHCHFLDGNGSCQIYEFRPLVCRTHGLPLKVSEEEIDEAHCTSEEDDLKEEKEETNEEISRWQKLAGL